MRWARPILPPPPHSTFVCSAPCVGCRYVSPLPLSVYPFPTIFTSAPILYVTPPAVFSCLYGNAHHSPAAVLSWLIPQSKYQNAPWHDSISWHGITPQSRWLTMPCMGRLLTYSVVTINHERLSAGGEQTPHTETSGGERGAARGYGMRGIITRELIRKDGRKGH